MSDEIRKFTLKCVIVAVIVFILYIAITSLNSVTAFMKNMLDIVMPFIIGGVIAYLLCPMVNKLDRLITSKTKLKQETASKISITLSEIIMVVIITACILIILPQTIDSVKIILEYIPTSTGEMQLVINKVLESNKLLNDLLGKYLEDISVILNKFVNDIIMPNLSSLVNTLANGVIGSINIVLNIVVGLVSSIFFLFHRKNIAKGTKRILQAVFGYKTTDIIIREAKVADKTFGGFVVGKTLDSFIIGVIAVVTLMIMKIPYAGLIGFIIGLTNIIPIAGPFIGAVPGAIILLALEPKKLIIFLIFVLILQQIDGNIIGPKCIGNSTGLNAAWVLISIMVFGGLWGLVGMIVGVPLMSMIINYVNKFTDIALEKRNSKINKT